MIGFLTITAAQPSAGWQSVTANPSSPQDSRHLETALIESIREDVSFGRKYRMRNVHPSRAHSPSASQGLWVAKDYGVSMTVGSIFLNSRLLY